MLLVAGTPLRDTDAEADVTPLRVFEGETVPTMLLDDDTDASTVAEDVVVILLVAETPLRDTDAEADVTPLRV